MLPGNSPDKDHDLHTILRKDGIGHQRILFVHLAVDIDLMLCQLLVHLAKLGVFDGISHAPGLLGGGGKQSCILLIGDGIDCHILTVHQLRDHLSGIEQYFLRTVIIQRRGDLIDLTHAVILVYQLSLQRIFHTHIAGIDILNIRQLQGQIFLGLLALTLQHNDLVLHIPHCKSQDEKLADPYIGVGIQHHGQALTAGQPMDAEAHGGKHC